MLTIELAGLPTAAEHLKGAMWAVADSMAGLCVVNLGQPCSLHRLTARVPLYVAHILCRMPESEGETGDSSANTQNCGMLSVCHQSPVCGALNV